MRTGGFQTKTVAVCSTSSASPRGWALRSAHGEGGKGLGTQSACCGPVHQPNQAAAPAAAAVMVRISSPITVRNRLIDQSLSTSEISVGSWLGISDVPRWWLGALRGLLMRRSLAPLLRCPMACRLWCRRRIFSVPISIPQTIGRRNFDSNTTALNHCRNAICWADWSDLLSVASDPIIQPVRCIGNHNRDKKPAFPRRHNKFLVFCDTHETGADLDYDCVVRPYAVWTGSFNFTRNAAMSLENALVLTDSSVVTAYFKEWGRILAVSELLDWKSEWCEPQWRIGT